MLQPQPFTPTIVQVVPPPTEQVGVVDVLVGSLGLTGLLVLGSIVLGGVLGALIIGYRNWRESRFGAEAESAGTSLNLSS